MRVPFVHQAEWPSKEEKGEGRGGRAVGRGGPGRVSKSRSKELSGLAISAKHFSAQINLSLPQSTESNPCPKWILTWKKLQRLSAWNFTCCSHISDSEGKSHLASSQSYPPFCSAASGRHCRRQWAPPPPVGATAATARLCETLPAPPLKNIPCHPRDRPKKPT